MTKSGRQRFLRVADWHNFLENLRRQNNTEVNLYELRQKCYQDIEAIRQRPLLIYSVRFPYPPVPLPVPPPISIDLEDIDGFTDLAESIEKPERVDVLIHSPGGSPEATERIVNILRNRFKHVTFIIPHSAYSAATMLALSGNEIIIHPAASLGPIDPQINGTPARALRRGFEKVRKAIKEEGPESIGGYVPLIEKYSLELLEICEDYEQLSKELATKWLSDYMFEGKGDPEKIRTAVEFFADYDEHKTHSRSLNYERIQHLNLKVKQASGELRLLIREAYILLNGMFEVSSFVKLFENSSGMTWGRQFQFIPNQQPPAAKS